MSYVYAAQGGGLYLAMLSALHGSLRGMPGDDSIGGPAAGAVLTKVVTPAPTSIGEVLPNIQQNVAHQSCIKINVKETSFFLYPSEECRSVPIHHSKGVHSGRYIALVPPVSQEISTIIYGDVGCSMVLLSYWPLKVGNLNCKNNI